MAAILFRRQCVDEMDQKRYIRSWNVWVFCDVSNIIWWLKSCYQVMPYDIVKVWKI